MKYAIVGALLFLGVIVASLPASLVRHAAADFGDVHAVQPKGTIWNGSALLVVHGAPLGRMHWRALPKALLKARIALDYRLAGDGIDLSGVLSQGVGKTALNSSGTLAMARFSETLAIYDLAIGGELLLEDVTVGLEGRRPKDARGTIRWSGGEVRYILSGRLDEVYLEPMIAELSGSAEGPRAEVRSENENYASPLVVMAVKEDGFVSIGVTKALTNMLNTPWPGNDPDQAIVLQVEEQIFRYQ